MIRLIIIASALLLARPALSADDTGAAKPTKSQKSGKSAKKGKADAKKDDTSAASLKPGVADRFGKKHSDAEQPSATPAQRAAVQRARNTYRYAIESCEHPDRCDTSLRDDAEKHFMDACRDCTTTERCEAERSAIREGRSAGGPVDVCGEAKK